MIESALGHLYPGEVLSQVSGYPCIHYYSPTSSLNVPKPLIVFIPGAAHNARIFYGGHKNHKSRDFPTFWLNKYGFNVLAISYPIESQPTLIPPTAPGFRINEWGLQAVEVTKDVMNQQGLNDDVILLGWSMAGKIVVPYCRIAKEKGLNVKLFVSLSATPGLPTARKTPKGISCTANGYSTYAGMSELFLKALKEQEEKFGDGEVIPSSIYTSEYFGETPISLPGFGLKYDGKVGFEEDKWGSVEDAAASNFSSLPMVAALHGTSQSDSRHALTDKSTWAFMFTQSLAGRIEEANPRSMDDQRWAKLVNFTHSAPERLADGVEGNHFFFIGERGARDTAEKIIAFVKSASEIEYELQDLLKDN